MGSCWIASAQVGNSPGEPVPTEGVPVCWPAEDTSTSTYNKRTAFSFYTYTSNCEATSFRLVFTKLTWRITPASSAMVLSSKEISIVPRTSSKFARWTSPAILSGAAKPQGDESSSILFIRYHSLIIPTFGSGRKLCNRRLPRIDLVNGSHRHQIISIMSQKVGEIQILLTV